jgi:hypothetical protein
MMITKQQALALLNKIGPRELVDDAAQVLPDPIDVSRHAHLLARYGLEYSQLMDRLGASP